MKKVTQLSNINTESECIYIKRIYIRTWGGRRIDQSARVAGNCFRLFRASRAFFDDVRGKNPCTQRGRKNRFTFLLLLFSLLSRSAARLLTEYRKTGRPVKVNVSREKMHSSPLRCRITDSSRHALINPLSVICREEGFEAQKQSPGACFSPILCLGCVNVSLSCPMSK